MTSATIDAQALAPSLVGELRSLLRGELVEPDSHSYDELRQLWNADVQRYPALIARCLSVADVIACVRFARKHEIRVSVRCAGHNISGAAVCDGGLLIDLGPMKGLRVDPVGRRVRAQGGCTWGDLDHATAAFGLATTGGVNSITGVGGLTLGGGIGWLMRKHGLACDNLVGADVVTAEGEFITVSATENPELLWALRGGGGNFGIVTEFDYQLHPVGPLLGGLLMYPAEQAKAVLGFYREFAATEPEEMTSFVILLNAPAVDAVPKAFHGAPMVAVCPAWSGPLGEGERVIDRLREFGPAAVDTVGVTSYVDLQRGSDDGWLPGYCRYWKSDYVRELSDSAIDTIVAHCARFPVPSTSSGRLSVLPIQPTCYFEIGHMEGAISRVGEDDSAVGHRLAPYLHGIFAVWTEPRDREEQVGWVRSFWEDMLPFSDGGAYVNYLGEEGEDRVRGAYGENKYQRLAEVKAKYDPTNFFSGQQNIKPAGR
jgi:FAD/FMN-containing dehydrogenase